MSHSQMNETENTSSAVVEAALKWTPELFWAQILELTKGGKVIQDFYDDDFSDMEEAGLRDCFANTEVNRADCEELNKNCK